MTIDFWYNITAINASNILTTTQTLNDQFMFSQLGNLLLIAIFAISFISAMNFNNNPKLNFMFCSFAVAIFSIVFDIFSLVSDYVPFLCWSIFAVSLAIAVFSK